jgi:Sulfotransferase family
VPAGIDPVTQPRGGEVCLFLHIPKAAGTTLKHIIYNNYSVPGDNGNWFHDGIYYFPFGFHKTKRPGFTPLVREMFAREDLRAVTGHFWYGAHAFIPRPCFYITLLREPVDRVTSLYHHIVGGGDEWYRDAIVSGGVTLDEFATEFGCREVDNDQTRRIAGVEPPYGRCSRDMLELAKRNLRDSFAFVGTTDRFDESLIALKRLLGWEYVFYLPGLVNRDRPPRNALEPEIVSVISERNEHDVALYEYAGRLLDGRIAASGDAFDEEVDGFRAENRSYIERARAAEAAG